MFILTPLLKSLQFLGDQLPCAFDGDVYFPFLLCKKSTPNYVLVAIVGKSYLALLLSYVHITYAPFYE